jgi:hypothetical protein
MFFTWLLVAVIHRNSQYGYKVKKDYQYDLSKTDSETMTLDLKNASLTVPEIPYSHATAFIKMNVRSRIMGHIFQPYIQISDSKNVYNQYFEHGSKGTRYLNISDLAGENEQIITVRGKNMVIRDQEVELIIYQNQSTENKKILVLGTHPDDAEIAAFGFYSHHPHAYVVTVTAGESGEKKYDELIQEDEKHFTIKGHLRFWNSITTPLQAGIRSERILNLGYFDGTLTRMYADSNSIIKSEKINTADINFFRKNNVSPLLNDIQGASNWKSLVADMVFLIEQVQPDIIVTPHPNLDLHGDHKITTLALFRAIKNLNYRKGVFYFYSNHNPYNKVYPYGKIGSMVTLPPNFSDRLYFRSAYSFNLDGDTQLKKIFALESMHDLRPDTEWMSVKGIAGMAFRKTLNTLRGKDNSYFRRSVRHNELFYILRVTDIYEPYIFSDLTRQINY